MKLAVVCANGKAGRLLLRSCPSSAWFPFGNYGTILCVLYRAGNPPYNRDTG